MRSQLYNQYHIYYIYLSNNNIIFQSTVQENLIIIDILLGKIV